MKKFNSDNKNPPVPRFEHPKNQTKTIDSEPTPPPKKPRVPVVPENLRRSTSKMQMSEEIFKIPEKKPSVPSHVVLKKSFTGGSPLQ